MPTTPPSDVDNPLPRFHDGGVVGDLFGPARENPAILEQGEVVSSRDQVAAGVLGGGMPDIAVHNYIGGRPVTQDAFDATPDQYDPAGSADELLRAEIEMFEHFVAMPVESPAQAARHERLAAPAILKLAKARAEQAARNT